MEICYIQEEGETFNYELFDKFTTYTVNNIQHFYGMQINFICFYLQRVKNTSNTKIIEKVNIFSNKIYEKLANVKVLDSLSNLKCKSALVQIFFSFR